ncbi:MAG: FGGY-family carbohydrate kinase [Planctomycetota bacterium]
MSDADRETSTRRNVNYDDHGLVPAIVQDHATGEAVNVLAGPDGKTMLMVCCRSGTVAFAQYVTGLSKLANQPFATIADTLTDLAQAATPDADGPLLWGFFQGENVTDLPHAKAALQHLGIDAIANPGLLAYLLLESPCMTLRYGLEQLKPHTGSIKRVVMTGGALKSKDGFAPQLYADLLGVPIHANAGDQEGSAKGAALLAAYTDAVQNNTTSTPPHPPSPNSPNPKPPNLPGTTSGNPTWTATSSSTSATNASPRAWPACSDTPHPINSLAE